MIATEEATIFYDFDDNILKEYKDWALANSKIVSKHGFIDYLINEGELNNYEIDIEYDGYLEFEDDFEEKIKTL